MRKYKVGDIVKIRSSLTRDEQASVNLSSYADLGGLHCRIGHSYNPKGYRGEENTTPVYVVDVVEGGNKWSGYNWWIPEDWFDKECMFGDGE